MNIHHPGWQFDKAFRLILKSMWQDDVCKNTAVFFNYINDCNINAYAI